MVSYKVLLERDMGRYTVSVPALPGCITQGRTRAEALDRAKEAIHGYLESLRKEGAAFPPDVEVAEISIEV